MELITPQIGLLFWMTISFLTLMFILKRFAWGTIMGALKEREDSISEALDQARLAKEEMDKLHSSNEKLLEDAKAERNEMIKEARELKDSIVAEAKEKAKEVTDKEMISARENIAREKTAAVSEIREQVALLSIEIAEKILKEQLSDGDKQKQRAEDMLKDLELN